jgi:lantibiotic modifying enzyme
MRLPFPGSVQLGAAMTLAFVLVTTTVQAQRDRPYLDVAIDAAKWIEQAQRPANGGATWLADPSDAESTGTTLYTGSPGVVLFLLELHRATGRAAYLTQAMAGADHLLAVMDAESGAGLYTGLAGIGFTLAEVGKATGSAKYTRGALHAVDVLTTRATKVGAGVAWNEVTDIIGGSSGIGLFLLYAARELHAPGARDLAAQAGRRLLEIGQPESGGRKWAMSPKVPRLMPNFSHGTAGIAYFLASLYRETRDRAFLDGALDGARYLQAIAKTDGDVCLVFHHEPDEDGKDLYYLGWCHGPAGTARLWYRLWEVTGDRVWLDWTKKSARGLLASGVPEKETPGFWNNVGQCCGSAGVAEFFLALHRVTKDPDYLAYARRVTAQLLAKATRDDRGARWVQAEHRARPTLLVAQTGWMQGAAGIGAWLVRLDQFERGLRPALTLPDSPF